MSGWQELRAERNRRSVLRLTKALPLVFPRAVLSRALARPFVPPTPRLAIESYWGAHPIRADRLARALAARSQAPDGWTWRLGDRRSDLPFTFRTPPAPYREGDYALGPGFCCVCGQPVYRLGWHVDLSTPEQKCIGWPEQKYISDVSRKAPETGVFCSGIRLGSDYLPTYPR